MSDYSEYNPARTPALSRASERERACLMMRPAISCLYPPRSSDRARNAATQNSITFRTSPTAFPRLLGGFQVNPDAALERRNDPAVSSNADPLDIGHLLIFPDTFDVAPLARHGIDSDLAGIGSHICREHFCSLRNVVRTQVKST